MTFAILRSERVASGLHVTSFDVTRHASHMLRCLPMGGALRQRVADIRCRLSISRLVGPLGSWSLEAVSKEELRKSLFLQTVNGSCSRTGRAMPCSCGTSEPARHCQAPPVWR